jgi:hypothetical protein
MVEDGFCLRRRHEGGWVGVSRFGQIRRGVGFGWIRVDSGGTERLRRETFWRILQCVWAF